MIRNGEAAIDDIIVSRLMEMENYARALRTFLSDENVTEALICLIGMNRKNGTYDKPYFELYLALRAVTCFTKTRPFQRFTGRYAGLISPPIGWNTFSTPPPSKK